MNNIFPLGSLLGQEQETQQQSEPNIYLKEYAFDFEKGEFIQALSKKNHIVDGVEAYRQWAIKTLVTPRYRHLGYSRDYGQEFDDLIRRNLTREANESEIRRIISEALFVDPRTKEVRNFQFKWQEDYVFCEFEVITTQEDKILLNRTIRR